MLLRTEYRCHFKYTVKYPYHHLLIKLRALCEHGMAVKIFQTEQIGSALRASGSNFRRVNLRKTAAAQILAKSPRNALLNAELGALFYIAQRQRPEIQLRLQRSIHLPFVDCYRHRRAWPGKYADFTDTDFKTVRCALFRCYGARYFYRRLFGKFL